MKRLLLLCAAALLPVSGQAASAGDEILASLNKRIDDNGDVSEVYDKVEDLPIAEIKALYKRIERIWPGLRDKYISNFQRAARISAADSRENKARVSDLRKELAAMKNLAEGPMKEALKKRGMPALNELRKLLIPNVESVMARADEKLIKERRTLIVIAGLRDTLSKAAIMPNNGSSIAEVTQKETAVTRELSGLGRKGLRIMEKNFKTAEKAKVPQPERKGVEDANIMRLLAGYNALEIDPKLCAAARDHSKDMKTLGFFAHQSPVKGKTNPADRARNFRTSASGENIYMGNTDPREANKAWFYSPGHHLNLFRANFRTIGLGQHDSYWTQMFGN